MTIDGQRPAARAVGAGQTRAGGDRAARAVGAGQTRAGGDRAARAVGAGQTRAGGDRAARAVGAGQTRAGQDGKLAGAAMRAERAAATGPRRELKPRMGRRLFGWDYCQPGIYVVTIVCADRRAHHFGELEVQGADGWLPLAEAKKSRPEPDEIEARVVLSALGKAVFAHFRRIGEFTPEIKPVFCAVMPDHLHLLLRVINTMARPLGNAIAGFKTGCEKIFAKCGGSGRLFAEGFVDHVIMREGQLDREFKYLRDNPRRAAVKALYPELFKVAREIKLPLWETGRFAPPAQGETGQLALPAQDRADSKAAFCSAPTARADGLFGRFSAIGNHFLLERRLVQVQMSRRDFGYRRVAKPGGGLKIARAADGTPIVEFSTPIFEQRRDVLFAEARSGAVLLSPCISDGERQIAREALDMGLALVTMRNKCFAPLQKPSGRYFDACAEGRLLMLAPAAWPYEPGEKQMTRDDATAMNRLCQWLAREGAAEINYRGFTPENIDGLALAAARAGREIGRFAPPAQGETGQLALPAQGETGRFAPPAQGETGRFAPPAQDRGDSKATLCSAPAVRAGGFKGGKS